MDLSSALLILEEENKKHLFAQNVNKSGRDKQNSWQNLKFFINKCTDIESGLTTRVLIKAHF
jgi:hypothetical protein